MLGAKVLGAEILSAKVLGAKILSAEILSAKIQSANILSSPFFLLTDSFKDYSFEFTQANYFKTCYHAILQDQL